MMNSNTRINHRRQLAKAAMAVLLLLGLVYIHVQPARAASVPRLVVTSPVADSFVQDRIFVRVTVNSQVPIAETKATAASLPTVSLTKQASVCGSSCEYTGWVDVSSLPWGNFTLTLSAVDVDGISSAPTAIALKHNQNPVINPAAPLPFEVADPNLTVNVSCTDDNPGSGCSSLKLSINGKLLLSGTNTLAETISAEQWLGQPATVQLSATDSSGLTSTQSYPIYVENVSNLTTVSKEAGLVLDTDASRTLLWNAYDHRLRIHHRDTNQVETLPLLVAEQTQMNVRLIPGGAMGSAFDATGLDLPDGYYRKGLDPLGTYSRFVWRNGHSGTRRARLRKLRQTTGSPTAHRSWTATCCSMHGMTNRRTAPSLLSIGMALRRSLLAHLP
ncbi:hypothetical protein [Paenibacillus sp. ATY16]|uniref:hypothetical protein n=1 Tax=Paenibacillus sp. ATY16 TaxID=1759312 RepID=UPI00200BE935|nr:hypothetical protein [Paenibacillus sp. ATY16]MCK9861004.1 hypothetical protein [Paenibacillus sp. ATY16]